MDRLLLIYNPRAGRDKIRPALSDIINKFTENNFLVTAYPTQAPNDAGDAITKWGASFDRIVIAGGDGTLNEAINGLLRLSTRPTIGYLPVGTTNDFSRNLDLPAGLINLTEVAATGIPRPCDVGRLNGRLFLYVAAFGAFTEVSYDTPQASKNLLGYTAYLLESVKYWGSLKPQHVHIQYDNLQEIDGEFLYVMVSNSTSVGRIRNFPPGNPLLDDGLLEVTLISPPKDIFELEQLSRILLRPDGKIGSPMLTTFSASHIQFETDSDVAWTLDGEYGGLHRIAQVEVLPHAFTILYGK